ncbi:hypothetical protein NUBL12144_38000 [Klebsiella pneumoniae]|nr:hypothetical protein NUBL12144_38000 [Klebsiella pneumoniae]DAK64098.1 MAG TPA: M domain protein [Caudoviricetes sp.]
MPSYGPQALQKMALPPPKRLSDFWSFGLSILNFLQTPIAQITPGFTEAQPIDQGVAINQN